MVNTTSINFKSRNNNISDNIILNNSDNKSKLEMAHCLFFATVALLF